MKSKKDSVSVLETMKELLSDTSGIIGTPEERAKWKQYYENQTELAKAVAAELENGNEQMTVQKKAHGSRRSKMPCGISSPTSAGNAPSRIIFSVTSPD